MSAAQLIALKGDEADIDWGAEVIERQAEHLSRLIDDLMDVTRIARGKVQLRKEVVDVRSVVQLAVEDVRPDIDDRKHELTVSVPEDTPWVLADPTRLRQIMVNLLTNAIKYTEPGGRIELIIERGASVVVLRVRDTGVGIEPEMLSRIFEMYAQVDRTLGRAQGGLGIGLTLVRQIAELHGGTVEAISAGLGQGSEFIVRLPALSLGDSPARLRHPRPCPRVFACWSWTIMPTRPRISWLLEAACGHLAGKRRPVRPLRSGGVRRRVFLDIGLPDGRHQVCECNCCEARLTESSSQSRLLERPAPSPLAGGRF